MHTILLIDPDVEECYTHLAPSLPDCQVIVQSDKEKGCKLFFQHTVDLVLLAHMPDNPCIDLLQVLRFIAPSVPVIIMAADGSEELAVTVFKCGAIDYLKKPLTVNALKKSIHAALGGRNRLERNSFTHSPDGIQRAIQYINGNYCLPLKLAYVAREAAMSVSCFERSFKKTLGVTFSMYLNKVRIARAIQMLAEDGRFSINQIAFACGFRHHCYFSKIFKRFTKTSPRDFKQSLVSKKI